MELSHYRYELSTDQTLFMRLAAEAAYPSEACGLFLKDGEMVRLENRSTVPDQFIIRASDYAAYDEQIAAIWHTHANYPKFSPSDIAACKTLGIPFAMWDYSSSQSYWLDPRQDAGLVGRPWSYGVHDCYAAVRDWFHQEPGVELGDYPRTEEGEWHSSEFTHFEDSFQKEGFRRVGLDDLKRGDVLFMRIRNQHTTNHVAIVEDPASGRIFHHMVNRLSEVGLYSHWLRENTVFAVRHESQCW